jgi:hypothetical protein
MNRLSQIDKNRNNDAPGFDIVRCGLIKVRTRLEFFLKYSNAINPREFARKHNARRCNSTPITQT